MCVRGGRSSGFLPQSSAAVSLKPTIMPWKRKKSWSADASDRLDFSLTLQYDSKQDFGSPEAPISRDEESSDEDRRFLPRFLLQAIIFARSPYGGFFFLTGQACRRVCCTDQIGFACEELRRRSARSSRFESTLPFLGAVCATQLKAGERSSARPLRLSTIPAGSQIQCLGLGAWAEQTAPALGAQTVPTTQIRISWMWTETSATTL